MQTINKIYAEKLKAIRPFTKLGINNRVNFTSSQKRMITIYYNDLIDTGLIEKSNGRYIQKVKFQKNKKSNRKGNPRINGVFIQGAMPNDRIDKKGRIVKGFYLKEFIPVDFKGFAADSTREYIERKLRPALKPLKLVEKDYFTIVLSGGWELGQNMKAKTAIKDRKHGREYTKNEIYETKIKELTVVIFNQLSTSVTRYKISDELIKGLFLYKFKKQRKPTKAELKAIK